MQLSWFIVLLICILIEAFTYQFVSIWFILGAIITIIFSAFIDNLIIQSLIFSFSSFASLLLFRPLVKKFTNFKSEDTNLGRYINQEAIVIENINNNSNEGVVKVNGNLWSARSLNNEFIPKGTIVKVKHIEGVKLIVISKNDN